MTPGTTLADLQKLAEALVSVYSNGDAAALQRVNRYYDFLSTVEDVRATVWKQVYKVRQAGGAAEAFQLPEARAVVAHAIGFSSWEAMADSAVLGVPSPPPSYSLSIKENSISPRRLVADHEWDQIAGAIREHNVSTLDANGLLSDEALRRIAELDCLKTLRIGGSRRLSDTGLRHLARMPQLEELDLSEYPGGVLTDEGLEVLRHLPNLRSFQMTWQKGISDAGASNLRFCEKLESVNLMGSPTGDGTIAALRGKPMLRRFHSGRLVTDAGLRMLREFPLLVNGSEGDLLIDGPFTNDGMNALTALNGLRALDLFWHVTGITSDGFSILRKLENLESLGCDGDLSDDIAMSHIGSAPKLRKLRAQGTVATDDGFEALSKSRSLEQFWGRECPNLAGRGFVALSSMPSLRSLGVSCKRVDDHALAALPEFPSLRDLTPIDVTDNGFRHVGRCEKLERLSCMYCRETGDIATSHISGLELQSYYAGLTQITDRSLEILGGMETLQSVELYEVKSVTNTGIRLLTRLPRLLELRLAGLPKVTLAVTEEFAPTVDVHYNV